MFTQMERALGFREKTGVSWGKVPVPHRDRGRSPPCPEVALARVPRLPAATVSRRLPSRPNGTCARNDNAPARPRLICKGSVLAAVAGN